MEIYLYGMEKGVVLAFKNDGKMVLVYGIWRFGDIGFGFSNAKGTTSHNIMLIRNSRIMKVVCIAVCMSERTLKYFQSSFY